MDKSAVWTRLATTLPAATIQRSPPIRAQALLGMASFSRDGTNIPRSSCHPLCDAGTHGPTHPRDLHFSAPIRALASSPFRAAVCEHRQCNFAGGVLKRMGIVYAVALASISTSYQFWPLRTTRSMQGRNSFDCDFTADDFCKIRSQFLVVSS